MLLPLLLNNVLEPAEGVDNLSATSVESASEVSSPTIGQVHVLSATSVQSTSEVSSPTIGQVHSLSATSVQSTSEVSAPTLVALSEHALTATSVESASQVSSPTLGQIHVLSGVSVQSLSEVSIPALNGAEALVGQKGAGSNKRRRTKYFAEINGEPVVFNTFQEARAYFQAELAKARESVSSQTDRQSKRIRRGKKVLVEAPVITKPSEAIQPLVSDYREDMESIYRQIAIDAELRELMRRKMMEEDEEDALFVLLH